MKPELDDLAGSAGEWLRGTGPESDVVISSRVRLARNLDGYPFLTQAAPKQRAEVEALARERIEGNKLGKGMNVLYLALKDLNPIERLFLVERHLISREHAAGDADRGVAVGKREALSIMVNEEDHLRIQVLRSGLQLQEAWDEISKIDDALDRSLTYAFSPQFGYLTACPTNVGTGMRISVMLHLPAVVMTKTLDKILHSLQRINFTVRGLYGEGTQATGDFYQISNQVSLGKSEEELVQEMQGVVPEIAKYEKTWREKLLKEKRTWLEDKVWRAVGTLKNARTISSDETLELLSLLRLGVNLGVVDGVDQRVLNELFVSTQPGHLQKHEHKILEAADRDAVRAAYIRKRLGA
ncbi:MAG: protein arginine kinase [Planctomycetes bacterium]|nr:protein arginine kinase [Planctomycetota bacterium]